MKNLTKLYFILVSLVSVIGLAVGYGIAGYNSFMARYISDDEYLSRQYYEMQACEQPDYSRAVPVGTGETPAPRTAAETAICKEEARNRVITARHLDTKETVIGGLVRGSIALILFLFHFPVMLKRGEDEHPTR